VPVWHERTRAWREAGELLLVGIAQEQHPDRCALFAQWQGLDWPILWDPFNLTGATAVPNVYAIDEHGVVRLVRPDPETFVQDFLARDFEPPPAVEPPAPPVTRRLALAERPEDPESIRWHAVARLLWGGPQAVPRAANDLVGFCARRDAGPADWFRAGVAARLRHDSPAREPGDFQGALDAWSIALREHPNQYIWRRRLQQYGPRLDKPYPFYDWIEQATTELRARGEEPVAVRAPLSGAEVATGLRSFEEAGPSEEPDPQGRILRDEAGWLAFESAVTFDTAPPGRGGSASTRSARVHLLFRPRSEADVHWNNSADPPRLWIAAPDGWRVERQLVERPLPDAEVSDEERVFDLEVLPPEGASGPARLDGYLLFHACEGVEGRCVYRRRDFGVVLELP
jgi:hypothetical protein